MVDTLVPLSNPSCHPAAYFCPLACAWSFTLYIALTLPSSEVTAWEVVWIAALLVSVLACTVSIRCARTLSALARAVCSLCRLAAVPPIEAESWSRRCAVAWRSLVATRSTVAIRPSASAVRASSSVVRVAWASFSVARTVSSWAARATAFQPRRASAMAPLPSSASSRVAACSTPRRDAWAVRLPSSSLISAVWLATCCASPLAVSSDWPISDQ